MLVTNLGRRRIRHALVPLARALRRSGADVAVSTIGALNLARAWHGHEGVVLNRLSFVSNAILLGIVGAYAATFADRMTWQVVLIPAIVAVPTAFSLAAILRR